MFGIIALIRIRKTWRNQHFLLFIFSINAIFMSAIQQYHVISDYLDALSTGNVTHSVHDETIREKVAWCIWYQTVANHNSILFLLTFDRLIAVLRPMIHAIIFPLRRCKLVIACWCLIHSFLISVVILVLDDVNIINWIYSFLSLVLILFCIIGYLIQALPYLSFMDCPHC